VRRAPTLPSEPRLPALVAWRPLKLGFKGRTLELRAGDVVPPEAWRELSRRQQAMLLDRYVGRWSSE